MGSWRFPSATVRNWLRKRSSGARISQVHDVESGRTRRRCRLRFGLMALRNNDGGGEIRIPSPAPSFCGTTSLPLADIPAGFPIQESPTGSRVLLDGA